MRRQSRMRRSALSRGLALFGAVAALVILAPLSNASAASRYTFQRLHSFSCAVSCNGIVPGGLRLDSSGNLYGVVKFGGKYDLGFAYKLVPNQDKTKYTGYVIHNFCARFQCPDGGYPTGDLIMDVDGNL